MSPQQMGVLIAIIGVTLSLSAVIIGVLAFYRHSVHALDCRHKERMAAIDKGLELPPEAKPIAPRERYLLRGLIWLGVGVAVTFALRDSFGTDLGRFGWIGVAVGVAHLILYFVEGRKSAPSHSEVPQFGSSPNP